MLMLLDVLTQLQDLDNRITLIAVLGLVALAGWAILVSWVQRRRGYHPYRRLADRFKTRSRRRSRREQRELAQGRSVVLGHTGWFVLKQPLILPETARCLNVLTLAPTGAGKSVYYLVTFLAVSAILTDHGREFRGTETHPYELYLALNDLKHKRTKVRHPQTNGFVERFHRTAKDEFFAIALRETFYESVEALQTDFDRWLVHYNTERPHQGYRNLGKRPMDTVNAYLASVRKEA
jgi:transposase InsO family protein